MNLAGARRPRNRYAPGPARLGETIDAAGLRRAVVESIRVHEEIEPGRAAAAGPATPGPAAGGPPYRLPRAGRGSAVGGTRLFSRM